MGDAWGSIDIEVNPVTLVPTFLQSRLQTLSESFSTHTRTRLLYVMAGGGGPIGPAASPLGQAWGYGIVLGVGFLFALGMVC
jgi:hypothetical protein